MRRSLTATSRSLGNKKMALKNHTAVGPSAGLSFQFERALFWLAKSQADFIVGIETADDVAIEGQNGEMVLEQDKHSIQDSAKPFGNRSKDLWNTLATWIDAVDSDEVIAEKTKFFMVTNKEVPKCIALDIGFADSDTKAEACVISLEEVAKNPPLNVKSLMERVLRLESRENLLKLIKNCELNDSSSESEGSGLRKSTIKYLQLPDWCLPISDSIIDELLGWLHKTVLGLWCQKKAAWIERQHFVNQLFGIIEHRKRQRIRERAVHLIPVKTKEISQEKGNPFVRQIHLISDEDSIVDNAIREFVRCNIEKHRLSAEGIITDNDWLDFESTLQLRWDKIRARIIRLTQQSKEEDIGYEIFSETTEDHREKLAGIETEQVYLTAGTYHLLANLLQVGWHPRYKELLRDLMETS